MSTSPAKRFQWLLNWLHINTDPVVKIYHGYGDADMLLIYGHVFRRSPLPRKSYRKNMWSNTVALVRLFMAIPYPNIKLQLRWGDDVMETTTDGDGFFKFEWKSDLPPDKGWHIVRVNVVNEQHKGVYGEGKILIPHSTQYAFVSDVDDTFLVSHSSKMGKRLYVLFTKNERTRKPFDGVVKNYRMLAKSNAGGVTNPFFYVSSSEWNLYEYLKEFCRSNELPEGVFLLNQLKQWKQLLAQGQTRHTGKFMRIARLMKEFPHQKFVLLGDDTQQDPYIYMSVVESFPGQVLAVYLRHIRRSRKSEVEKLILRMQEYGIEVCYFKHSNEAIRHSMRIGLINEAVMTEESGPLRKSTGDQGS